MNCTSWGMYPKIKCEKLVFNNNEMLQQILQEKKSLIPRGNGRSYGDSALHKTIVNVRPRDYFIDFNKKTGLLHIQAGVLLSEIIEHFIPRGWFLKITPGSKLITVGGAIASDVHGKNHHIEGCFSECVKEFTMMIANGKIVTCSKENHPELFKATCGGQGLTGVILDAKIYLKKINSQYLDQITIRTGNLNETFEAFEKYSDKPYSVAWMDCLAKNDAIGRCLLMAGSFKEDGKLDYRIKKKRNIPINLPSFILNNWSVRGLNAIYYNKVKERISKQTVDIDNFFYPLDSIGNWNRIYGINGFIQYQFILPKEKSYKGLGEILGTVSEAGKGSFLTVLKLHGKANDNWLSFPMEGYSLAMDFKVEKGIFALLDRIDKIIIKYNGRIYLTKDARVSGETFKQGYPQIETFRQFRRKNRMDEKFQSIQSRRVGI